MGAALNPRAGRLLAQVLGIAQRIIKAKYDHSSQKFSPRKLIPGEPKTLGDFLLLERIESDLTQPELAKKADVTELRVRAWEYNHQTPTPDEWQVLTDIFAMKNMPENLKPYGGL